MNNLSRVKNEVHKINYIIINENCILLGFKYFRWGSNIHSYMTNYCGVGDRGCFI